MGRETEERGRTRCATARCLNPRQIRGVPPRPLLTPSRSLSSRRLAPRTACQRYTRSALAALPSNMRSRRCLPHRASTWALCARYARSTRCIQCTATSSSVGHNDGRHGRRAGTNELAVQSSEGWAVSRGADAVDRCGVGFESRAPADELLERQVMPKGQRRRRRLAVAPGSAMCRRAATFTAAAAAAAAAPAGMGGRRP